MNKIFCTLLFLFTQYCCTAQTDRTFWFAAPDIDIANYPQNGPYDRPIYLRLTSITTVANVTISIPANASFVPINLVIPANSTSTVDLTQWIDLIENADANSIKNKGILIQSTADITAYYEVNSITCGCNPELFSLKGKNAIGNEFYIPSQLQWAIDTIRFPDAKAAFDIVATENNTAITITPAKVLIGRPANTPFTINLNRGQSFSCQALYRSGNSLLNGSKVVSDKPIAITTKEDLLFSDGPCADLAGDQLVPTSILGNEFAVVRGNLSLRDKAVITGTQNNTKVYLDGNGTAAATINAGQSYEIDLTSQPSIYIKTDKAVNVIHYTGEGCEVGSAIIPKLNCTGSSTVSIVRSNPGDAVILLVTKNGNQGNFLVNGSAGIINAADFSPLVGTGGNYVYCKKSIPGAMPLNIATTFINTTGKFQLGFINALSGGCMYGYFSDFKKSNVSSSQVEICQPDSAQLNAFGGSIYQWSPATGLSNPNISNPKASPATTTDYKVIITDADGCMDSAFVKVIVNTNCMAGCNSWLNTPSFPSSISIGDLDVTGNQLTVEANYNSIAQSSNGSWGHIVSKHTTTTNVNYALSSNAAEITTSTGYKVVFETCPIQLNKTYHTALVYDGATLKFYRNGFLLNQIPCTGNLVNNDLLATIAQVAGASVSGEQFTGYINEVRIWNVARTQTELRTYMNTPLPTPTSQTGLKGYYIFDNLLNKQGNPAFNGTINGAATINTTNPQCNFVADSCPVNTPISNIINQYTPVLGFDKCKNILTVGDGTNYKAGDTVLLIQMKGAVIDSTNTAAFGTITDYKNAGNYEFNYIKSKTGNNIELLNTVIRNYDIPNGKVQLVRVPYYQSVNVTSTLTCKQWDGSSGGILVLNVADTITLNANIDVKGKGFLGGAGFNTSALVTNCFNNDYNYPSTSLVAAKKGESISSVSNTLICGKGAPAGGGGGGLDHNSGGGGGGNGGGGGFGGYQLESCGNAPFDNRGIGGKNLTYNAAANKIFMGSGGGAGHANNPGNIPSSGGNGGGIAIIIGSKLKTNGNKIIANGDEGLACTIGPSPDCHDGMGGGGAGGTVLMNVQQHLSNQLIETRGGKGADLITALAAGRIGTGGGGGGGILFINTATLPPQVTNTNSGGTGGVIVADANNPWGSTAGTNGNNVFNLVIPFDNIPFRPNIDSVRIKDSVTSCSSFNLKGLGYTNTNQITNWQWYFGDGATFNAQNTAHTYQTPGTYTIKLLVTDSNGCKDSIQKNVTVSPLAVDAGPDITVCKNAPFTFNTSTSGATIFAWTPAAFLNDSTLQNPTGTITTTTKFYLTVKNILGCLGKDSVTAKINAPVFSVSPSQSGCSNTQVQLIAAGGNTYLWSPPGMVNNPTISNPLTAILGTQLFTVKIKETTCNDSATLTTLVTINPAPLINVTKSNDIDCSIEFSKLQANGALQYVWTPSTGLSNNAIANPVAKPVTTTQYFVKGTNSLGCSNNDSITVAVTQSGKSGYLMANSFSPNGDGINDCFGIKYWGVIEQLDFFIYNRYGEKVFYTNDPNNCWNGNYKTKKPEPGNYVYYIKAKTACGTVERKGNVILIR